jgi:hypothetical protein
LLLLQLQQQHWMRAGLPLLLLEEQQQQRQPPRCLLAPLRADQVLLLQPVL